MISKYIKCQHTAAGGMILPGMEIKKQVQEQYNMQAVLYRTDSSNQFIRISGGDSFSRTWETPGAFFWLERKGGK